MLDSARYVCGDNAQQFSFVTSGYPCVVGERRVTVQWVCPSRGTCVQPVGWRGGTALALVPLRDEVHPLRGKQLWVVSPSPLRFNGVTIMHKATGLYVCRSGCDDSGRMVGPDECRDVGVSLELRELSEGVRGVLTSGGEACAEDSEGAGCAVWSATEFDEFPYPEGLGAELKKKYSDVNMMDHKRCACVVGSALCAP